MLDAISYSEARKNLATLMDSVCNDSDVVVIMICAEPLKRPCGFFRQAPPLAQSTTPVRRAPSREVKPNNARETGAGRTEPPVVARQA